MSAPADRPGEIRVTPFEPAFQEAVTRLIVGIQRREFGIDITAEQQPDLRNIVNFYQSGRGNFWVALDGERVVGTASLLDIGDGQAALRKMFVDAAYRGTRRGVARDLLGTLLHWAREQSVEQIFLGTTPLFLAAHRFYEKHGFSEIGKEELPAAFPIMEVDTKFYTRALFPANPGNGA